MHRLALSVLLLQMFGSVDPVYRNGNSVDPSFLDFYSSICHQRREDPQIGSLRNGDLLHWSHHNCLKQSRIDWNLWTIIGKWHSESGISHRRNFYCFHGLLVFSSSKCDYSQTSRCGYGSRPLPCRILGSHDLSCNYVNQRRLFTDLLLLESVLSHRGYNCMWQCDHCLPRTSFLTRQLWIPRPG